MKQFIAMAMLIALAIGCEPNAGESTAETNIPTDQAKAMSNPKDTKQHPAELLAKLRSLTGENDADSIIDLLDLDLAQYEEMNTGQATVVEYKLNDIFFLRRSTDGTVFQNGKPVWIYCTEK